MKKYIILIVSLCLVMAAGFTVLSNDYLTAKITKKWVDFYSSQNENDYAFSMSTVDSKPQVKVIKTDGDWVKVQTTAWVKKENIEVNKPTPQSLIAKKITPSYPKDAANAEIDGDVKLQIVVDKHGQKNIEILNPAKDKRLTNIARVTINHGWEFKRYRSGYKLTLMVHFKIVDHQQQVQIEYLDLNFAN